MPIPVAQVAVAAVSLAEAPVAVVAVSPAEAPVAVADTQAEDTQAAQAVEADSPVEEEAVAAVAELYADKKKRALWRSFLLHCSQEGLDELHSVEALQVGHFLT